MIDVEVIKFIEIVKKRTINVPEQMNIRNMIHLHDFQKRFIYTNLKRFRYYLKLKVEQDWNSTNDVQFFESCEFVHEIKVFRRLIFLKILFLI